MNEIIHLLLIPPYHIILPPPIHTNKTQFNNIRNIILFKHFKINIKTMINKKINKWIVILLILSIFLSIANFSVFAADEELKDFGKIHESIKNSEKDEQEPLDDVSILNGNGNMQLYWGVPILRLHGSKLTNMNISSLNVNLSSSILNLHDKFVKQFGSKLKKLANNVNKKIPYRPCQDSIGEINNNFFEFQMEGGYEEYLLPKVEFQIFEEMASKLYDLYVKYGNTDVLSESELVEKLIEKKLAKDTDDALDQIAIYPWATVHADCSCHLEHDHPEAGLSAVYYVKMPPGAGGIILHDPRSAFHEDIILHPKEGEFIMFPPWLRHTVLPTHESADEPRITIAWNAFGEWEETRDVHPFKIMDIDNVLNKLGYDNLQAYIEDNPTGELNVVLHRIFSHVERKKKRRNEKKKKNL